jgi:hypothetical protein
MSKTTTSQVKDVFHLYKESFEKIQGHVEKTTAQYTQSFTNLQQEYLGAWKNFVNAAISVQQQYANKTGINTSTTEAVTKVVQDSTEEIIKAFDVQSKIAQTIMDAARQNVRTVGDNTTAFAELNQNIINSWISTWTKN